MLLEDLKVILKVAEFRSITAAAESLDMRVATASAAVKRVEKYLGAQLFVRTTRHLMLSKAGERYIPNCEQALFTLDLAHQNIKEQLDVVDGELRVGSSSDFGRNLMIPWLDEFMGLYQGITAKVHLTDSNIDFYRDPVDIALRYGKVNDSNLYGFKICNVPRITCAAPDYLSRVKKPEHPQDLTFLNGLFYQLYDVINDNWEYKNGNAKFKIKMYGNRSSNDGDLVRRWCVSGQGVAIKSCLDVADDLLNNRLTPLIPEYIPEPTELWMVCPSRQSITPAVRLARDFIREKCYRITGKLVERGFIRAEQLD